LLGTVSLLGALEVGLQVAQIAADALAGQVGGRRDAQAQARLAGVALVVLAGELQVAGVGPRRIIAAARQLFRHPDPRRIEWRPEIDRFGLSQQRQGAQQQAEQTLAQRHSWTSACRGASSGSVASSSTDSRLAERRLSARLSSIRYSPPVTTPGRRIRTLSRSPVS